MSAREGQISIDWGARSGDVDDAMKPADELKSIVKKGLGTDLAVADVLVAVADALDAIATKRGKRVEARIVTATRGWLCDLCGHRIREGERLEFIDSTKSRAHPACGLRKRRRST